MTSTNHLTLSAPEELLDIVSSLFAEAQYQEIDENRIEERTNVFVPIAVQPLDAELHATGGPMAAVTRNISMGGMAFFLAEAIESPHVRIDFEGANHESRSLILEVRHHTSIGPFYLVGGQFRSDWA